MSEEVPQYAGIYGTPHYQQPICTKAYLKPYGELVVPTISTYQHLTETLAFNPELQQQFDSWVADNYPNCDNNDWESVIEQYIAHRQWHLEYTLNTPFEENANFDRHFIAIACEYGGSDTANSDDDNVVIVRTLNGYDPEFGFSHPYFFLPRYVRRMREYGSGLEVFDIHRIDVVCPQCDIVWHNEYDGSFVHTVDKPEGSVSPNAEFTFTWDGTSQCPFCKTTLEGAY